MILARRVRQMLAVRTRRTQEHLERTAQGNESDYELVHKIPRD